VGTVTRVSAFTGVVLLFTPSENFTKGSSKPSIFLGLRERLQGSGQVLAYCICAGFLLVILAWSLVSEVNACINVSIMHSLAIFTSLKSYI
jgi:ABC-type bacteriocin/lantibiotic exporter with double-glycine peptidase domain